jgi:hypothetical protein
MNNNVPRMGGGDPAIIPKYEAYSEQVQALRDMNALGKFYGTDYEFAEALFHVPMVDRETWLDNKVNNAAGCKDMNKLARLNTLLDKLIGGFK